MISIEQINYYKPHWHEEMLVFALVLNGSVDTYVGCDRYRMRTGNILLINTEEIHSFSRTDEDNTVLFIRFDCRLLEYKYPGITHWELIGNPAVEEQNKEEFKHLRVLMAETAISKSAGNEAATEITGLLNYCRDTFLLTNMLLRNHDIHPQQMDSFQKLSAYIRKYHQKPLTLGDVSEYIDYSFNQTSSVIKLVTGMNFEEYLNHIRCLAAERMILSTDKNISEIAEECGFNDSLSLEKSFKYRHGITPAEYLLNNKKLFPEAGISSFKTLNPNEPHLILKLQKYITAENRTIRMNMKELPAGHKFKLPILGITDLPINNDEVVSFPQILEGIFNGKIKALKQTDDKGPFVFNSDSGLSTHSGIKKALFYVYDLLSAAKTVIHQEDGIIICRSKTGIIILLFAGNVSPENRNRKNNVKIVFDNIENDYLEKRYQIDKTHGNPYKMWEELDKPESLTAELEELIIKHSVPLLKLSVYRNRNIIELSDYLPAEGAVIINLIKI